ncbi:MAG: 3H domain-containing protein [Streptococcus salivarius]
MNGQSLAEHFGVTRQIIVQDIALLRADGARLFQLIGIFYKSREDDLYVHRLFKVNHKVSDMEDELLAIVDNGGRIQNIMIDHPVYGEIQTLLKLTCRRDVSHFLDQASSNDFRPLSDLTNGVHYHLVEADSEQDIDYIEEALNHLGFLVKE